MLTFCNLLVIRVLRFIILLPSTEEIGKKMCHCQRDINVHQMAIFVLLKDDCEGGEMKWIGWRRAPLLD